MTVRVPGRQRAASERRRGVFYIHVMKTGGVSLTDALRSVYGEAAMYPSRHRGRRIPQKTFIGLLTSLPAAERAAIECYSVHMPAWTAELAPPTFLTVTALREPVERTISHLRQIASNPATPGSLEAVYADPQWRSRLSNYQTRIFAATRDEHEAPQSRSDAPPPAAVVTPAALRDMPPERAEQLRAELRPWRLTGISHGGPLPDDALARAIARLERTDEVGVTPALGKLAERIGDRIGRRLPRIEHHNVGSGPAEVSNTLLSEIRADCTLDEQLYEVARERGGA